MNKYQEALEFLRSEDITARGNDKFELLYFHLDNIEELVDKATPKKPIKEENLIDYDEFDTVKSFYNSISSCPNCKELLFDENDDIDFKESPHCPYCGQKLDWSDEE